MTNRTINLGSNSFRALELSESLGKDLVLDPFSDAIRGTFEFVAQINARN